MDTVYIPEDLEDSITETRKLFQCPDDIKVIMDYGESTMDLFHHSIGQWMRNNWGLWTGSRLSKWFNERGIEHADDMSGIILTSFWRRLHDVPLDLANQIDFYQDYWEKQQPNKEEVK